MSYEIYLKNKDKKLKLEIDKGLFNAEIETNEHILSELLEFRFNKILDFFRKIQEGEHHIRTGDCKIRIRSEGDYANNEDLEMWIEKKEGTDNIALIIPKEFIERFKMAVGSISNEEDMKKAVSLLVEKELKYFIEFYNQRKRKHEEEKN